MIRKLVPASSCIRNGPFFYCILGPVFSIVEDKLVVGSHGLHTDQVIGSHLAIDQPDPIFFCITDEADQSAL